MSEGSNRVALVTGASRGAGAGIARALGSYGMRVYVTGRAETVGEARGWDGAALPGTIYSTAAEVTEYRKNKRRFSPSPATVDRE